MTTPTSRTDAVYLEHRYWANEDEATEAIEDLRDLARELERELANANAILASIEEDGTEEHNAAVGLRRELATERETSRLLRVAMDARDEGYTQSRRRMSALESELTAKGQAVRNLAEVISGQDKELATERQKVRVLRDACESICEEWGRNYNANPIGAGQRMETLASKSLEKLEQDQENS